MRIHGVGFGREDFTEDSLDAFRRVWSPSYVARREDVDGFRLDVYGAALLGLTAPWVAAYFGGVWLFVPIYALSLLSYRQVCRLYFSAVTPPVVASCLAIWAIGVLVGAPGYWDISFLRLAAAIPVLSLAYLIRPRCLVLESSNVGSTPAPEQPRAVEEPETLASQVTHDDWPSLATDMVVSPPPKGKVELPTSPTESETESPDSEVILPPLSSPSTPVDDTISLYNLQPKESVVEFTPPGWCKFKSPSEMLREEQLRKLLGDDCGPGVRNQKPKPELSEREKWLRSARGEERFMRHHGLWP